MKTLSNQGIARGLVLLGGLLASLAVPLAAQAQTRPALVRSVDEPARVPYAYSQVPTCNFSNQCTVTFPAVPAGKRLRVTNVQVVMFGTTASGFVMIGKGAAGAHPLLAFPIAPFSGAYWGNVHSLNQPVDLIFEAGETITLEMGVTFSAGGINVDSRNHFGVTGYLVDTAP